MPGVRGQYGMQRFQCSYEIYTFNHSPDNAKLQDLRDGKQQNGSGRETLRPSKTVQTYPWEK